MLSDVTRLGGDGDGHGIAHEVRVLRKFDLFTFDAPIDIETIDGDITTNHQRRSKDGPD